MPGVTTRLFEEPIECSRILPVMGCTPRMKVARKWKQVNQYTNEPPTLGCIVQQDRRAERNPMLMGDGRMEWNEHVNVTVRVYHSSSDPLLSRLSLPSCKFNRRPWQEKNGLNRSTVATHSYFSVAVSRNWQWQGNMPVTTLWTAQIWWIWQCPIQCP